MAHGSTLWATEFIILIKEIFLLKLHAIIQGYADDLALMHSTTSLNELLVHLQEDINTIKVWLDNNKLIINPDNTKYIWFPKES